jgi:hypothetical protein
MAREAVCLTVPVVRLVRLGISTFPERTWSTTVGVTTARQGRGAAGVNDGKGLRACLQRASMSPEQFARRLNRYAAQLGSPNRIDPKTPYKWLRGTMPREPWPALAAAILSTELGCHIRAEDLGWKRSSNAVLYLPADTGLELPWSADGAVLAASEVIEVDAMDRRVFLQLTGTALTQPAFDWLITPKASAASRTTGRRVHDSHVDSVQHMTGQLRRMDDQFGGGAVLDLVHSQIQYVLNLLRNHRYTTEVGERLHGVTAELLRLAGWLSFDAGRHSQAQRYWLAALRGAHTAGDRSLGANILGFMSCQAKDLELYTESIKLAEASRQGYPGASPKVRAILNLRAAEAYAQTGDTKACRAAIDAAYEAVRDTPPESGEPAWSYWMDEAQVNAQAGYCYMRMEDWSRAQNHLRTALRLQADTFSREGALRRSLIAITHARQGDPEQACEVATRAVQALAEDVDSDRCVGHVRRVQQALTPYRKVTAVRDFDEHVNRIFGVPA